MINEKIPLYNQYATLVRNVKYFENLTNGMKETGGAAMLYDGSDWIEELLDSMSEAITEIEEATEPVEVLPMAPNTGSEGGELAGTIAAFALTGTVGIAAVTGAVVVAKRYAYSPLKRRK